MTDRELLKLAAVSCGELRGEWVNSDAYFDGVLSRWNPLDDDGDALRLAVAVGMTEIKIVYDEWPDNETGMIRKSPNALATRRAIVRAAAEIGKEMK